MNSEDKTRQKFDDYGQLRLAIICIGILTVAGHFWWKPYDVDDIESWGWVLGFLNALFYFLSRLAGSSSWVMSAFVDKDSSEGEKLFMDIFAAIALVAFLYMMFR